jgi:hypothetical protein
MKSRLIFYFNTIFEIRETKTKQVFIYIFLCVSVSDDSDGGLLVRALISSWVMMCVCARSGCCKVWQVDSSNGGVNETVEGLPNKTPHTSTNSCSFFNSFPFFFFEFYSYYFILFLSKLYFIEFSIFFCFRLRSRGQNKNNEPAGVSVDWTTIVGGYFLLRLKTFLSFSF